MGGYGSSFGLPSGTGIEDPFTQASQTGSGTATIAGFGFDPRAPAGSQLHGGLDEIGEGGKQELSS